MLPLARGFVLILVAMPLALFGASRSTDAGEGAAADDVLRTFYLEATVDVEDEHGPGALTHLRWWYQAPDLVRAEFETLEPADEAGTSVLVWDGDQQWFYNHREGTHSATPLPDLPEGMHPPLPVSTLLGPVPGDDIEALLDEIAEEWRLIDTATLLGREVQVYEWGPTWHSSGPDGARSGGTARVSVDTGDGMILRSEVDAGGGGQSYLAEVTRLDWNVAVSASRFEFTPPAGSQPADAQGGDSSSGSGSATAVPAPN
ncbi:MAG: hypothetical protein GEU80_00615 [Dehalococcoidia bacterium]|nr:hypothetical protein [Dehalococcoidia bacterium]